MSPRTLGMASVLSVVGVFWAALSAFQTGPSQEEELLRLHERVLRAHREGNVDAWLAVEADEVITVTGGRVSSSRKSERAAGRRAYLERAEFEAYRDAREPMVKVSEDGSLGWVIAEVEVVGRLVGSAGEQAVAEVWAWVELYERRDEGWRMVGNVSNSRPLQPDVPTAAERRP